MVDGSILLGIVAIVAVVAIVALGLNRSLRFRASDKEVEMQTTKDESS